MNEDAMTREDRKWLQKYLNAGVTVVNFTKKNGDPRTMICTLKRSLIPQDQIPEGSHPHRQPNPDVQVVFDLEVGAWRSFRLETVNWYQESDESEAA